VWHGEIEGILKTSSSLYNAVLTKVEGSLDGDEVGRDEGEEDGISVGMVLGVAVGVLDGSEEGIAVGEVVGDIEEDGTLLGSWEGWDETEGERLGSKEGIPVGVELGYSQLLANLIQSPLVETIPSHVFSWWSYEWHAWFNPMVQTWSLENTAGPLPIASFIVNILFLTYPLPM
jgi:hypothetical protein